ncbi:hypothetical protein, partial [Parasphingorhabdus sp.]
MSFTHINRFLFLTVSSTACVAALAAPAWAQAMPDISDQPAATTVTAGPPRQASAPIMVEDISQIVVRDDLSPDESPPTGVLDDAVDITGVGQMATRPDQD